MNLFDKLTKAMQDLDDFMDDASSRRLGNGAKFYGKRKSNFYGEEDSMRKSDPRADNAEEDYAGPGGGSYFVLSKERDEKGRPIGFLTKKEAREERAKEEAALWAERASGEALSREFQAAVDEPEA